MASSDLKGICRNVLGGESGTLKEVFGNLRDVGSPWERHDDPYWSIHHSRVDLPKSDGIGGWDLISVRDDIFAILTECEYFLPRSGPVPAEGLIGFHFVLDGPVEIGGGGTDRAISSVTMLVCNQAEGVSYNVYCPVGMSRMLSLYVRPEILRDSFGLSTEASRLVRRLCEPAFDTVSTFETMIGADFSLLLDELMKARLDAPGGLVRGMSLLVGVVGRAVEAILREGSERGADSYTAADLQVLDQARRMLSTDLARDLPLAEVARTLGTNQTKLKRGLKTIFGITASAYRRDCRMREAKRLLSAEGLPASTVAHRVGYRAHASFTAAFHAYHGMTPKETKVFRSS